MYNFHYATLYYMNIKPCLVQCWRRVGYYGDTATFQGSFLTFIGSIGLMLWLASTRHSKETEGTRFGIFLGFTFLSGEQLWRITIPENDFPSEFFVKNNHYFSHHYVPLKINCFNNTNAFRVFNVGWKYQGDTVFRNIDIHEIYTIFTWI